MNNALKFNGTSTYVEVPGLESPTKNGGAITIEFWNKVESSPPSAHAFWFKTTDNGRRIACHAPWSDSYLYWDCGSPANIDKGGRLKVDYSAYLGKWTHIALVSAGNGRSDATKPGMAIYINGELKASSTASEAPAEVTTGLVIGAWMRPDPAKFSKEYDYWHQGMMDQFRVWNRVRSQEEIKRDMYAELIGDEPGLVTCFNFNWGIANTSVSWLRDDPWKSLPNSVANAPAGILNNFAATDYVESGVPTTAPVGPVFRLTKGDADCFTASYSEKASMIKLGWAEDASPAFYAHRAPTPGTTPLYRLRNSVSNRYRLTASRAEREALDPRTHVTQQPGTWMYDGEIAYVSTTKNGSAVPLYECYTSGTNPYRYTTAADTITSSYQKATMCYVLPSLSSSYAPTSIVFDPANGLSEQLWYMVVCRSNKADWGLALFETDAGPGKTYNQPTMAAIPESGYARFQWRLEGGRLINRAVPDRVLTLDRSRVVSVKQDDARALGWTFGPVPNKGTDCFSLVQGNQALAYEGNSLVVKPVANLGPEAQWTLLATEPRAGYTIPGPPASHTGRPFNKYLAASDGKATVNILGTGTVSDWAMLRSKLIVENMLRALQPAAVDTKPLDGVEVLVISKDDSNEELDNASCIGYLHTKGQIEETRGGAHGYVCYVTEEMMWKNHVFNSKQDVPHFRYFDQLVHEFGHVIHQQTSIDENLTPVGETPASLDANTKAAAEAAKSAQRTAGVKGAELFAMSVQSWFDSIAQTEWAYYPATRDQLNAVDPERYQFMAKYFDPQNTWKPPIEFRSNPSIPEAFEPLTMLKLVRATASSQNSDSYNGKPQTVERLLEGPNSGSNWWMSAKPNQTAWIQLELASLSIIKLLSLRWLFAKGLDDARAMKYRVLSSADGTTWVDTGVSQANVSDLTRDTAEDTLPGWDSPTRFIRLELSESSTRGPASYFMCHYLLVYGMPASS